jgi:hypothetical protein
MILFLAALLELLKPNGVMSDFVKEDGEAQGGSRNRGFDPVDAAPVLVTDPPGAPAHAAAPLAHAHAVASFHQENDPGIIRHGLTLYRLQL